MVSRFKQLIERRQSRRDAAKGAGMDPHETQARALVAAIDEGGVPLNPYKVNEIARGLGLEVSSAAPMDETIVRIRAALAARRAAAPGGPEGQR